MEYVENFPLKGNKWLSDRNEQINELVNELNLKSIEDLDQWRIEHRLVLEESFQDYVEYRTKRRIVISEILKNVGESLFLRYKDRLDRVLYSLIRVESEDLAYKLYYEIESRELEFGDAAATHSCGPESKNPGNYRACRFDHASSRGSGKA